MSCHFLKLKFPNFKFHQGFCWFHNGMHISFLSYTVSTFTLLLGMARLIKRLAKESFMLSPLLTLAMEATNWISSVCHSKTLQMGWLKWQAFRNHCSRSGNFKIKLPATLSFFSFYKISIYMCMYICMHEFERQKMRERQMGGGRETERERIEREIFQRSDWN